MFVPIEALPNLEGVEVCIIGAGAAGITIARKIAELGHRVLLCEGGMLEYTAESQSLYAGTVRGDHYYPLDVTRLRYFGGSTNHWGGICRPLDDVDFRAKSASDATAWPISKGDLDPFLTEASAILEVPPLGKNVEIPESGLLQIQYYTAAEPVRLGEKYFAEFEKSATAHVCLNANLISFQSNEDSVVSATFSSIDRTTQHNVNAKYFILATGGIENSRLLLWLNHISGGKIVKEPGTLGRYWSEHPHYTSSDAVLWNTDNLAFDKAGKIYFAPTEQMIQTRRILNCRLSLQLMQASFTRKLITELACAAPALGQWAFDLMKRQLFCGMRIRATWEQEPVFENRIELDTERDAFQIPRPVLHWTKSALDYRTCRETVLLLAFYFARTNRGRVRIADWLLNAAPWPYDGGDTAGHHHIGGTRMAKHPKEGVVDLNLKVFGISNLYVAGSSVFPAGGYANPTLSIVQLSLRLAEHLHNQLT